MCVNGLLGYHFASQDQIPPPFPIRLLSLIGLLNTGARHSLVDPSPRPTEAPHFRGSAGASSLQLCKYRFRLIAYLAFRLVGYLRRQLNAEAAEADTRGFLLRWVAPRRGHFATLTAHNLIAYQAIRFDLRSSGAKRAQNLRHVEPRNRGRDLALRRDAKKARLRGIRCEGPRAGVADWQAINLGILDDESAGEGSDLHHQ